MVKIATSWTSNPNSVSSDTYDISTRTYDTIYAFYDGNQTTTQSPISQKVAAIWSQT